MSNKTKMNKRADFYSTRFYWEFNGTASKLKIGAVSLIYSKSVVNRYLAYFDGHHAPHPEVIKIWRFH